MATEAKIVRLIALGEKIAIQLGGVFTVNPRKIDDFRRRARAQSVNPLSIKETS